MKKTLFALALLGGLTLGFAEDVVVDTFFTSMSILLGSVFFFNTKKISAHLKS